jgi:hypothetical protein
MYRRGLPYWWVTPRWTAEEVAAIKKRAHERAEKFREAFDGE